MGGDCTYTISGQPSLAAQDPSAGAIEYMVPNGSCQIRETAPKPPRGIFQYRTPDGSYNVRPSTVFTV